MTHSTLLFVALLVAIIQACTALYVGEGLYEIGLKDRLLTDLEGEVHGKVGIDYATMNPMQYWYITKEGSGEFVIKNEGSKLYLSYDGSLEPGKLLRMSKEKCTWKLPKARGDKVFIETVKKFDGEYLVVDQLQRYDYSPLAALDFSEKSDDQMWTLNKVERVYEKACPCQY